MNKPYTKYTEEEQVEILKRMLEHLLTNTNKPLDSEFTDVVTDNFWELL